MKQEKIAAFTKDLPAFQKGSRVKLVSSVHGDSHHNPVWGGREGNVVGVISMYKCLKTISGSIENAFVFQVDWENGSYNSYRMDELKLV